MTEVKMEDISGETGEESTPTSPDSSQIEGSDQEGTGGDDMSLAVLIAMVPLLVFTLMGQVGLL